MDEKKQNILSEILTDKEIRRYALQINLPGLGIKGQEKIKKSRILVIGAGGKGSSTLQNLASAGVGRIGICDNYPVAEDQLCRQHLYGDSDLGKQKAIISRQKLLGINHLNEYRLHNVYLTEHNIDLITSEYDILIDTTDNFPTHYLINDTTVRTGKAFIFGNFEGSTGFVSVFNYKGGPSLRCHFPYPPIEDKKSPDNNFACRVIINSVIGSILANEALKVIIGIDTVLNGNMLSVDMVNYKFSFLKITKNPLNFR